MVTGTGFEQCYNAQAAVDEGSQLIVAASVVSSPADYRNLVPMLDQTEYNTDLKPQMVLADTGYASEAGLSELEERGQPACVALGRDEKRPRVQIFFFPAEDGIRYYKVTGVQTCSSDLACSTVRAPVHGPSTGAAARSPITTKR